MGLHRSLGWLQLRIAAVVCVLLAGFAAAALARPSAMKLLPEETLLLVRTPNAAEMFERLRETGTGRMVRDPQVAPFVERLYGSAGDLYTERVAEWLGVSWEELQNLPRAEVAFAIVARRDFKPAFMVLIDQGEEASVAKTLLDNTLERIREKGDEVTKETIRGTDVTVIHDNDKTIGIFEKDNTIVASTDPGLIYEILGRWGDETGGAFASTSDVAAEPAEASDETASTATTTTNESAEELSHQYGGRTLAENQDFITILRHCRREHDPPPNFMLFVDPIGLIRQFNKNDTGAAVMFATFPALGVDGLAGIGATMTFSAGRFDSLSHLHVLLDNPRSGVMQVIAFEPSEVTPPAWVFADVENYMTWNWNVRTSFNVIRSLVDRFQFEGRTDEFITKQINEKFEMDFEKEIIDNVEGRVVWVGGFETPAHFRGQQTTIGIKVVDEEQAKKTVEKFVAKYPEFFEKREFGGVTYYAWVIEWPDELKDEPPNTPLVAVTDGYFFLGGSCQLFERTIAARDGTVDRLADRPDFMQLAIEVQQEAPGITPAVFAYSRFEITLRQWYDVLQTEKSREFLEERAAKNPFFAALLDTMNANELPPFDVLAQYALPGVAILYDTDTGYHGITFAVRDETAVAE